MTKGIEKKSAVSHLKLGDREAIEYFVILTVLEPRHDGGRETATLSYVTLAKTGITREYLIKQVDSEIPMRFRGKVVMFFSAEPNHLPPGEYLVMATMEQASNDSGLAWLHRTTAFTVPPGISRGDIYSAMKERMSNAGQGGSLVFFSAEPNQVDAMA